jgi:hypothetical protein
VHNLEVLLSIGWALGYYWLHDQSIMVCYHGEKLILVAFIVFDTHNKLHSSEVKNRYWVYMDDISQ